MKLEQGQTWQKGGVYYRIVKWSRLAIIYKEMKDPDSADGWHRTVTKKEFCRLIKGAELLKPDRGFAK